MVIVAPSILSADFAKLLEDCRLVLNAGARWLHLDVMDGHFVPNLTIGPAVIKSLYKHLPDAIFDCHLMVSEPFKWCKVFADAGVSSITFHYEAMSDPIKTIELIRSFNLKVGISIKPNTPVSAITNLLSLIDIVLVMTVEPGFGGQKLIPECLCKISELIRIRNQSGQQFLIQIDGGVDLDNYKNIKSLGADVIVAGTAIFGATDPVNVIHQMLSSE